MAMIRVTTKRLVLRPIGESDHAEFVRVHRASWAGHLGPWSPAPPLTQGGEVDFEAMFEQALVRSREGLERGTGVRLLAFLRGSGGDGESDRAAVGGARGGRIDAGEGSSGDGHAAGRLVGGFNLNNIVRGVFENTDAGWWVARDHLRCGYAAEGVGALVRLALLPRDACAGAVAGGGAALAYADGVSGGLGLHRVQCGIVPENAASLGVAARAGFRREGVAQRYLKINGRWQDHVILAITAEELVA